MGGGRISLTKEGWVRVAFVSSNKEDILRSRWVEKKKESAHYGQNEHYRPHQLGQTCCTCATARRP